MNIFFNFKWNAKKEKNAILSYSLNALCTKRLDSCQTYRSKCYRFRTIIYNRVCYFLLTLGISELSMNICIQITESEKTKYQYLTVINSFSVTVNNPIIHINTRSTNNQVPKPYVTQAADYMYLLHESLFSFLFLNPVMRLHSIFNYDLPNNFLLCFISALTTPLKLKFNF